MPVSDFRPIELQNPVTGATMRLARSYDTMLYDTARTPVTPVPAGLLATLFAGNLDNFAVKTGAEEDDLIVSSKLPTGSVALVHRMCFAIDVQRPQAAPGALPETVATDVLNISRECFATFNFNGQTQRRLGRLQFYPPWWDVRSSLGGQVAGGFVSLSGQAVDFEGPMIIGAWGSSQVGLNINVARAIAMNAAEQYDITAVLSVTMLNPINEGDGI